MLRACITTGDTTTHGGTLMEGEPSFVVMGKYAVTIGHKFWCPQCKCWSIFIEGDRSFLIDGRARVLQGHKTSCGAIAIHTQNNHEWSVVDEDESAGKVRQSQQQITDPIAGNREDGHYTHSFFIKNNAQENIAYTLLEEGVEIACDVATTANYASQKAVTVSAKKVQIAISAPKPKI